MGERCRCKRSVDCVLARRLSNQSTADICVRFLDATQSADCRLQSTRRTSAQTESRFLFTFYADLKRRDLAELTKIFIIHSCITHLTLPVIQSFVKFCVQSALVTLEIICFIPMYNNYRDELNKCADLAYRHIASDISK